MRIQLTALLYSHGGVNLALNLCRFDIHSTSRIRSRRGQGIATLSHQKNQWSWRGVTTVKRARSEDVPDLVGEGLKLGLQIGCNNDHQFVESSPPIGFLKSADPGPQRLSDVIDVDENIFGDRNAIEMRQR